MSKLFLVPTPIGNLEDMTLRGLRILKECDIILAEDTRTSAVLLNHYGIEKKVFAHHMHNEHHSTSEIVKRLLAGEKVALISDAGSPGISDPGFLLVRESIKAGVEVESLPGATAFVPALVQSGLPCERFCFEGFLPQKKGRQTRLTELAEEERTMIFYESPFRLVKTLEQLGTYFGKDREASVSRELTKMFEETVRGTLASIAAHFTEKGVKGEIVIVVRGKETRKKKGGREERADENDSAEAEEE